MTAAVIADAHALTNSMRKLRRAMKQCAECPQGDYCNAMLQFNNDFTQALKDIAKEWKLDVT
jgi:hypothetical protein